MSWGFSSRIADGRRTGILERAGLRRHPETELAERLQPPAPEDLPGRLGTDAEQAADSSGAMGWAVPEGEVRLLRVAVPLHDEKPLLVPGRAALV